MQLHHLHEEGHPTLAGGAGEFRMDARQEFAGHLSFGTGVAQHTFCSHCGMHAFYIPRSQPDRITVNARCLDDIDGPSLKPSRFFDGRHWEEAQRRRIAEGGHVAAAGLNGTVTLKKILDRASE
jgi:hypothetical protein